MQAIVLERYGSPDGLRLRDIEKPAVADDRILVKVHAASVNAADWHLLKRLPNVIGRFLRPQASPARGADLAGRVEAVGKSISRFKPGDEVFGVGSGSFAEYATSTAESLALKPRSLTFEQAAAVPIAGLTALQGLRDHAHLRPGQTVLIYGAGGGVGTFAVQIAKALGARVTAVTNKTNVDLVRTIGADEVIDYTTEDFVARGHRYDVVFDLGADRSLAEYGRVLTSNGTFLMVGAPARLGKVLSRMAAAALRTRFSRGARWIFYIAKARHADLAALKELADAGKIVPVVDRRYPLSAAAEALRYLGTRKVRGKVVINVNV